MTDKNKVDGKFNQRLIFIGIGAVALIFLVLWLNWYWLHNLIAHDSLNDRGTFGDMFGVSTALFSGAAFVGIIVTIWMQKEELSLQRQELIDTREVLDDQAKQLESQSKTLIAQKDENTFFQMLKLHNDIVEKIQYETNNGRFVFIVISDQLIKYMISESSREHLDCKTLDTLSVIYKKFYIYKRNVLGGYYRLLYHILKFVSNSQLEPKKMYTNIVRAQLSERSRQRKIQTAY